jgi:hypothetical protein
MEKNSPQMWQELLKTKAAALNKKSKSIDCFHTKTAKSSKNPIK